MLLGGVLIIKLHRITLERRTLVRKAGLPEGEDAEVETSVGDRRTWCRVQYRKTLEQEIVSEDQLFKSC